MTGQENMANRVAELEAKNKTTALTAMVKDGIAEGKLRQEGAATETQSEAWFRQQYETLGEKAAGVLLSALGVVDPPTGGGPRPKVPDPPGGILPKTKEALLLDGWKEEDLEAAEKEMTDGNHY